MITDDEPTDPKAAPEPHRETGHDQLVSIMRNAVRSEVRPIADAVLELDARQRMQGRAIAAIAATRIALPVAAFVLAVATLALVATLHSDDRREPPAARNL